MRPAHVFMLGAGLASVVGAASAAAVFLALKSEPQVADKEPAQPAEAVAASDPCQGQAWPHFDQSCLAHKDATRAPRIVGTDDLAPRSQSPVTATATPTPAARSAAPQSAPQPAAPQPAPQPAAQPDPDIAPLGQAMASPPAASSAPLPQPRPEIPTETTTETTGAAPAEPAPARAAASSRDEAEEPVRKKRKSRKARQRERTPRDDAPRRDALAAVEAEIEAMERRGELPGMRERDRRVIILRPRGGGDGIWPFMR